MLVEGKGMGMVGWVGWRVAGGKKRAMERGHVVKKSGFLCSQMSSAVGRSTTWF